MSTSFFSVFSKSRRTLVGEWIHNETFWAVVTLMFLWVEVCSWRTGDASLTVPKGFVVWAFALVVDPNLSIRAFTIAGFGGGVVFGSSGAFSALFGDGVKELAGGGITFDTVVGDFIVAIGTF